MPNPENLIGKGFDANPQNINKEGRPRKIYTILKESGYSKDDIRTAFGEIAWYKEDGLKEILADDTKPVITKIVAKAFSKALEKGDFKIVKEIMEIVLTGTSNASNNVQINFLESF